MTPTKLLIAIIDLHGGAGTFCRLLATGLRRHHPDLEPHLLVWRDRGLLPSDPGLFASVTKLGAPIRRGPLRALDLAAEPRRLRRALRATRPDVILTAGTYANLLLPRLTRTPVLMTEHNHLSALLAHAPRTSSPLLRAAMRLGYRRLPIAVPSEGVAADLRARFGATHVHVIPHGLDRDRVLSLAAADRPADCPPDNSYIVAVGRLAPQKDYPTLLRAYALARQTAGVTQSLLIVGDGPDLPALQSLTASLGLAPHVTFLGHRDNPFPYIAHARCYALSSLYEGFGLALLEAMTLGRPCVSTDCPAGPAEILANGAHGPLVPMSDAAALSRALIDLCTSDAACSHYAAQAAARSRDYSLQSMATRYHDLIRSLIAR